VQLASNAHDAAIRSLIVELLNELQPEVNECHKSTAGQNLRKELEEKNKVRKITRAMEAKEEKARKKELRDSREAAQETAKLGSIGTEETQKLAREHLGRGQRTRRAPDRFSHLDYDDTGGFLLSAEQRQARRGAVKLLTTCEICYKVINDGDGNECDVCGMLAHRECHGVAEKEQEDFMCSACQGNIAMKHFSQKKSTSRLAASKLDKGKGKDMAGVDDEIDDEDEEAENTESEGEADDIEQPSTIELDESYHGTDGEDSNSGEDLEGPKPNKSRFVAQQRRDDELNADEDMLMLTNKEELAEFISDNQPDDETRHRLALISLPANKIWAEADLDNEFHLRVGLLLLYNRIQGKKGLSLAKSIHIRYASFPESVVRKMEANMEVDKKRTKMVKKKLDS
jgi:hypothetical protein